MTKQNASEYLPLMTALAEGKQLQFRLHANAPWKDCTDPSFNRPAFCYRVKPEPRKVYAVCYPDGGIQGFYSSISEAQQHEAVNYKIITFVEQSE